MKEQESNAVKIMKIIQEFMTVEAKTSEPRHPTTYNNFFASFYDTLAKKVDSIKKIESHKDVLANKANIEIDKRGTVWKKVTMEHSTSFFAEIVAHIMMIMDINFRESEELFKKVKNMFIDLLVNFSKVPLENLKEVILEEYYNDLIYSMVAAVYSEQSHYSGLQTHCQSQKRRTKSPPYQQIPHSS